MGTNGANEARNRQDLQVLAAELCLYLATRSLDPTGRGRARWVMRWKPALNAFGIAFDGRLTPTTTNQ
jgi:hypothetical protein